MSLKYDPASEPLHIPDIRHLLEQEMGIKVTTRDPVPELIRAVRMHFSRYVKNLEEADQSKASLGLAHSYSRSKVKFNVNRQDNMIIQVPASLTLTHSHSLSHSLSLTLTHSHSMPSGPALQPLPAPRARNLLFPSLSLSLSRSLSRHPVTQPPTHLQSLARTAPPNSRGPTRPATARLVASWQPPGQEQAASA